MIEGKIKTLVEKVKSSFFKLKSKQKKDKWNDGVKNDDHFQPYEDFEILSIVKVMKYLNKEKEGKLL